MNKGIRRRKMIGMGKRDDEETKEREVRLWLRKKLIPYERYRNLSLDGKAVLRNLVCIPTRPTTYEQRKDLYRKLCLPDVAGRESVDPLDFMLDEERKKFFMPLSPSEKLHYLEKF